MSVTGQLVTLAEAGKVPDVVVRAGIRHLLRQRLAALPGDDCEALASYRREFLNAMGTSPLAVMTDAANRQHYEVPARYYDLVLGPRKKYSCCYWGPNTLILAEAETNALRMTCERAGLADGQRILELGCGWGSLTLWMAEHYPGATITAVSNSSSQRRHIEEQAQLRGITNVQVITADMNDFEPQGQFDRIVSLEMFEHMRNWSELFRRVASWLANDGQFFMHVFCHRNSPYFFETADESDWMSRYFFSGGMMPSADLPLYFQSELRHLNSWFWNGNHYAKTLEAWLQQQDEQPDAVREVLKSIHGDDAKRWEMRWRLFYMACAELFRMNGGNEWFVGHYLFDKRPVEKRPAPQRGEGHG